MGLKKILGLRKRYVIESDGLYMTGRNPAPLDDPKFTEAWNSAAVANRDGWPNKKNVPDIRLRALVCITAAKQALLTQGCFVECGVHTGLLSSVICNYLNFGQVDREFYLFDTFEGVPTDGISGEEQIHAREINKRMYFDCYEIAKRNFSNWPNVHLVRGILPATLEKLKERPISYLSIDLNSATYEIQVIERLWDQISDGGVIVLDDYGWAGRNEQFVAWNKFCDARNTPIFFIPTGQGLIFKHSA
jgi:hypothetical protein